MLDVSGSMQGKYSALVEGVRRATELTNGFVAATPENVKHYADAVAAVTPGEGTNLHAGLSLGLRGLDAGRTAGLILVTDGVANVGETHRKGFLKLVNHADVRLFTFIMGNSANRPLLESLISASGGFAASISNSDDIVGKPLLARSKVTHQALHDVEIHIDGVRVSELTPRRIGSLYRGQQLVVMGRYSGGGEAQVTLKGRISGEERRYATRFVFPERVDGNPELERLWAYATIEHLNDEMELLGEQADSKQALIDLGVVSSTACSSTRRDSISASRCARDRAGQPAAGRA
ncbi:MAG: hypothetical protein AB2807_07300 [Candidatus Sedimenticola endophacoides]